MQQLLDIQTPILINKLTREQFDEAIQNGIDDINNNRTDIACEAEEKMEKAIGL